MATKLTNNFTLEELCASDTAKAKGIKNAPDTQAIVCLTHLATNILQPLREAMRCAILIGSGYRCPALNKAVGGASTSQHLTGQAVDIFINGDLAWGKKVFAWIKCNCQFDQLIWEHNAKGTYWVHVSFNPFGKNRNQVIDNLLKR